MRKTVRSSKDRRAPRWLGPVAVGLALSACMTAGVAFADEASDLQSAKSSVPLYLQSGLVSDQDAEVTTDLQTSSILPTALDLRHYNGTITYDATTKKNVITGGINYVSPVKLQNPFGSCWAFSICASAETSLLTSLDKADDGEMNGSIDYTKAASGEAGKVAYNASNLSERALAYSIFTYPKSTGVFSSQAGEGSYLVSGVMGDGAQALNTGGMPFSGVSTFSCGIGPTPEYLAPYISDEGWVQVPSYEAPTLDISTLSLSLKYKYFTSLTAALEYMNETWTDEALAKFNDQYKLALTKDSVKPARSAKGTWSVESENIYGTVAELTESKILESTKGDGLSDDEIASMKEELAEGRAISIAFCADQSRPGQSISTSNSYLNTDNWAQYTYEKLQVNHGVTIVGYDDDYDASNFTHNQYKQDESGQLVIDEEKTALTTPEGNGAWIVKNSWGSTDTDEYLDQNNWGIDGSGYFYLSYYDKNISCMESYEFDTSQEAQERTSYATEQYDLSKGSQTASQSFGSVTQTCNVFDGPEQGEDSVAIRDLGCLTGATCDTVTLDVYVMDDSEDAATVIEQNDPTYTASQYFDKVGFHRITLDDPIVVTAGKKLAVVQTTRRINGKYEATYIRGYSQELATAYNAAHTSKTIAGLQLGSLPSYTYTVVNEGESLIYTNGEWLDWTDKYGEFNVADTADVVSEVHAEAQQYKTMAETAKQAYGEDSELYKLYTEIAANCEEFTVDAAFSYDNFSIKIYGDTVDAPTIVTQPESYTGKLGSTASFSIEAAGINLTYKWQYSNDGGATWKDSTLTGTSVSAKLTAKSNGRQYRCIITDEYGATVTSDVVTITAASLSITAQPANYTGAENTKATFAVVAEGTGNLTYKWQYSDNGSTWKTSKLTSASISAKLTAKTSGRQYRCIITDAYGNKVVSGAATMTIG